MYAAVPVDAPEPAGGREVVCSRALTAQYIMSRFMPVATHVVITFNSMVCMNLALGMTANPRTETIATR